MESDELILLASNDSAKKKKHKTRHFLTEWYGIGKYIRKYGFYPDFLPLYVSAAHGIYSADTPPSCDTIWSSKYHFILSPRFKMLYEKSFKEKIVHVYYSTNVYYRKRNRIIIDEKANGTLAFPFHNAEEFDYDLDFESYIKELKDLPQEFQPVEICLHYRDILKGYHEIYQNNGFKVHTAGNAYDDSFIKRFYSLIRNFKYTTSNNFTSSLFYSVEMGIPHFIYGSRPVIFWENGNTHGKSGVYEDYLHGELYINTMKKFSYPDIEITDEKMKFVETELGLYDGISRAKMAFILYLALFDHLIGKFKYENLKRNFERLFSRYIWKNVKKTKIYKNYKTRQQKKL